MFKAPNCERYTYRGGGTKGRCWVCTPEEGEIQCPGCLATEAETLVVLEEGCKAAEAARHERDSRPYGFGQTHWAIEEFGSALAAIEAIVNNVHGYREFAREVPHLLAWELSNGEVTARWHELLAVSDTLLGKPSSRQRVLDTSCQEFLIRGTVLRYQQGHGVGEGLWIRAERSKPRAAWR